MDRTTHFLIGFALALLASAIAEAVAVRSGGEIELVAAGAAALTLPTLAASRVALFLRREGALRAVLVTFAIGAFLCPQACEFVSRLVSQESNDVRGNVGDIVFHAMLVAAIFGPLVMLGWAIALALLERITADRTVGAPGAELALGVASAFVAAPYLMSRATGLAGSMQFAATLIAVALTLRFTTPGDPERASTASTTDATTSEPRPSRRPRRLVAMFALDAAFLLAGGLFGRIGAWFDGQLGQDAAAAFAGPASAAFAGACLLFARSLTPTASNSRDSLPRILGDGLCWFVFGFATGRILPRAPDSTLSSVLALGGAFVVALALLGFAPSGRRRVATIACALGGLVLAVAAMQFPSTENECEFEADGAAFEVRVAPDGRRLAWHDGVPLHALEIDSEAAMRAVGIALCQIEEPRRILVLGCGGAPFVRPLLAATADSGGEVTWVTPLRGDAKLEFGAGIPERLEVVVASERGYLERHTMRRDLVLIAPPARSARRIGRLLTTEFAALVEDRLTTDGVAVQCFHTGALRPIDLIQKLLPTAGFSDYRVFLDHPANPTPLVLRFVGRQDGASLPERIERRLPALTEKLPALARGNLDLRGVLQCWLFDRSILDLWFSESWENRDDRMLLAFEFEPLVESDPRTRAFTLDSLSQRRGSIAEMLGRSKPSSPLFGRLRSTIRRDHAAAQVVLGRAISRAATGAVRFDSGGEIESVEMPWWFRAAEESPDFQLSRGPLDRYLRAVLARRDNAQATDLIERLLVLDPDRSDLRIELAQLLAFRGAVSRAEEIYRSILVHEPGHVAASAHLAFLLAGYGDAKRRMEAIDLLDFILVDPQRPLDPFSRDVASIYRAMLGGDLDAARAATVKLGDARNSLALLRYLALPRARD